MKNNGWMRLDGSRMWRLFWMSARISALSQFFECIVFPCWSAYLRFERAGMVVVIIIINIITLDNGLNHILLFNYLFIWSTNKQSHKHNSCGVKTGHVNMKRDDNPKPEDQMQHQRKNCFLNQPRWNFTLARWLKIEAKQTNSTIK